MPRICQFAGILVYMYFNDHLPPHFHAIYGDHEMLVTIDPVGVYSGNLPATQKRLVLNWAQKRQSDLKVNWQLARNGQPLQPILP